MPKVLLCPPTYFDVVDEKNPYMSRESVVNRRKARSQWDALRSVLQQSGCELETIDPVEGLEDMVFAANQFFIGQKTGYGKFVVPSRMVYESRQREVPFYVDWCRRHDYQVIDWTSAGTILKDTAIYSGILTVPASTPDMVSAAHVAG
jgi:N-dimethylarginine dimethylaminohydrolase